MWDVILFVYLLGILLSQPVYIWAIGTLCRMEDEDEELYCQDNGLYYEPRKPNYPLVMVLMVLAGIFWPLVILFAIFLPLTFILMDKMGQLHPEEDEKLDPEEDTYLYLGGEKSPLFYVGGSYGNYTKHLYRRII